MDVADLCNEYPLAYHMAALGSWPSIQRRGLLSTTALLARFIREGAYFGVYAL